jgi:hypothetical protein
VWGQILPGAVLDRVGAHNAYRMAGVSEILLLGGAALGARGWRPGVTVLLGLGVLAESFLAPPLEWRMPAVADPAGPLEAWLAEAAPPGAILDLPLDRGCENPRGLRPTLTFHLQTVHGRAIASGRCARSSVARLSWVAAIEGRALAGLPAPPSRPAAPPPPLPDAGQAAADRDALRSMGFAYATLDLGRVEPAVRFEVEVAARAFLGEPTRREGERMAFRIQAP